MLDIPRRVVSIIIIIYLNTANERLRTRLAQNLRQNKTLKFWVWHREKQLRMYRPIMDAEGVCATQEEGEEQQKQQRS